MTEMANLPGANRRRLTTTATTTTTTITTTTTTTSTTTTTNTTTTCFALANKTDQLKLTWAGPNHSPIC